MRKKSAYTIFKFFSFIGSLFVNLLALAKDVTITNYMDNPTSPNDLVCELLDPTTSTSQCYRILDYTQNLNSQALAKMNLKKPGLSDLQGEFEKVTIQELAASEVNKNKRIEADTQRINIYVKVKWSGKKQDGLGLDLSGEHVVKGVLQIEDNSHFKFYIDAIPDLMMFGFFNPSLDIAEIFGRNASSEATELDAEIKMWMQSLLNAVLPAYFENLRETPEVKERLK